MYLGDYSSIPIEVPENHQRSICDLTPADRLAIYEHVVKETGQQKTNSKSFENDSDLYVDLAAKLGRGLYLICYLTIAKFKLACFF